MLSFSLKNTLISAGQTSNSIAWFFMPFICKPHSLIKHLRLSFHQQQLWLLSADKYIFTTACKYFLIIPCPMELEIKPRASRQAPYHWAPSSLTHGYSYLRNLTYAVSFSWNFSLLLIYILLIPIHTCYPWKSLYPMCWYVIMLWFHCFCKSLKCNANFEEFEVLLIILIHHNLITYRLNLKIRFQGTFQIQRNL